MIIRIIRIIGIIRIIRIIHPRTGFPRVKLRIVEDSVYRLRLIKDSIDRLMIRLMIRFRIRLRPQSPDRLLVHFSSGLMRF